MIPTIEQRVILHQKPPVFAAVCERFPFVRNHRGVIFSYGAVVYNPDNVQIGPALTRHEAAHGHRQVEMGVDLWWARYLTDDAFMFNEELIAHTAEWEAVTNGAVSRQERRAGLKHIAKRLAGPLYGHAVDFEKAKSLIQLGAT